MVIYFRTGWFQVIVKMVCMFQQVRSRAAAESCMAAAECGFILHLMLHQFGSCYELFKMHYVSCSKYCKAWKPFTPVVCLVLGLNYHIFRIGSHFYVSVTVSFGKLNGEGGVQNLY